MADDLVRQSAASDAAAELAPPAPNDAYSSNTSGNPYAHDLSPPSTSPHRPSSAGPEGGLRSQYGRPSAEGDGALPLASVPAPAPIYASADPPPPEAWQLPGNPPMRGGSQAASRGSQRPPSGSQVSMAEQRRRQQQQQQQRDHAQESAAQTSAPSSDHKARVQNGRTANPLAASLDLSPLGNGAAAGGWAGTL